MIDRNIVIISGKTWKQGLQLKKKDNSPYDLSGKTVRGEIRSAPTDIEPVAIIDCTIDSPSLGHVLLLLTDEATAAIPVGSSYNNAKTYRYDIDLLDNDEVRCIQTGTITVKPGATK